MYSGQTAYLTPKHGREGYVVHRWSTMYSDEAVNPGKIYRNVILSQAEKAIQNKHIMNWLFNTKNNCHGAIKK